MEYSGMTYEEFGANMIRCKKLAIYKPSLSDKVC